MAVPFQLRLLPMIDGRPSSEYEPDPDRVDYFYLPQASAAVPAA